ncbi:YihY/virulence factor BrkB family protein [Nodosilinea sp. LEGE 07088]|uniref:YihY/virulence factor BrkB family protein n=1 Tax=Nodosilinea sp. LEGE 07088 TaxID=2777968 RepID=UPI00188137FE|nr:YihY/virulence factor BrkB family protein [Nodosilinea sp. LEGE 07088]MBE9139987.1 YihY/virulence factor BrkB family protein [Nodosilinea sp. LEGE 07088]
MAKRFWHHLSPTLWVSSLAVYGNGRLWREVWTQAARSRWSEVGAAVAFFWLLGLLGLSFGLLQWHQTHALPPAVLGLAHSVQTTLALAVSEPNPPASRSSVGVWQLGLLSLVAWVCLVSGTQKLIRLITLVYSNGSTQPHRWRTRLLPWGITLMGLGIGVIIFALVDRNGEHVAQPGFTQWVWRLSRWALALGSVALGLGLGYRLVAQRWTPGLPLWAGVRLVLALGLGLLGLRSWALSWLAQQNIAYGLLLTLGINLGVLYGCIWLVPLGAQVNLSLIRHRAGASRPWSMSSVPPPPSFDSFKIKRRD